MNELFKKNNSSKTLIAKEQKKNSQEFCKLKGNNNKETLNKEDTQFYFGKYLFFNALSLERARHARLL